MLHRFVYTLMTLFIPANLPNNSHGLPCSERWLQTANKWLKSWTLLECHRNCSILATYAYYNEQEVHCSEEHCVGITVRWRREVLLWQLVWLLPFSNVSSLTLVLVKSAMELRASLQWDLSLCHFLSRAGFPTTMQSSRKAFTRPTLMVVIPVPRDTVAA